MFKGTSFGRLRRLWVLLPVTVVMLAVGHGSASAAVRQGCTPPLVPDPTNPNPCGSATVSASTTFTFNGQLLATNFGSTTGVPLGGCDPTVAPCAPNTNETECPSQAVDTANVVCEHFTIKANVAGSLRVCVPFDAGAGGLNDVEVFIVDQATGRIVGTPGNTGANPACATASLAVGQTVEILVNPAFIDMPISFTATVTFTANPTTVKSSCFQFFGHHQHGAGEDDHHGKFHGEGHRDDKRGEKGGRAQYRNDDEGYDFHSTSVSDVQFTQLGTALNGKPIMQMVMTGQGVNNGQLVTFTITMISGGLDNGVGDSFLITTSDGGTGGGQVTNGANHYKHYDD